jgi:hypothetical protein
VHSGQVPDHDPVRVVICLRPSSEPISGTVAIADRAAREFAGWVELTFALEDARLTVHESGEDRRA